MPDWKSIVREHVASLRLNGAAEVDLIEELAQHLEDEYRVLCSGGLSEQDAYQKVLSGLNDLEALRGGVARVQRMPGYDEPPGGTANRASVVEEFRRDVRHSLRLMARNPGFSVFVVAILALGMGATTTVYTVVNTLVLNPLPRIDTGDLVAIATAEVKERSNSGAPLPISYADLNDYQIRNKALASMSGYTSPRPVTWREGVGSQQIFAELVTGEYFATLGLTPFKGRFFLPEESRIGSSQPAAILNYGTWQSRFGGNEEIVGKTLRLNDVTFTIVGVAPPDFIGLNAIFGPDLWVSATVAEQLFPTTLHAALSDRTKRIFFGVARLRAGVTPAQAEADIAAITSGLAQEYPDAFAGRSALVRPVAELIFNNTGGGTVIRLASAILFAVVVVVLMIACSNIGNLLLARAAGRQQEMAVRSALGADRRRLVQQLLTESVLLGIIGGAVGLLLAYAGLQLLFGMLPASSNFVKPRIDLTVFAFAFFISVSTGILFGALPAFAVSRTSVAEALKEGARTIGRGRRKVTLGNALLVGQVAFSFVLLATAALFIRSIQRAYDINPGFDPAHLAVFTTNPGPAGYGKERTRAFYRDVRDRVRGIAGVQSASWASNMPLWARPASGLQVEGRVARSRNDSITAILHTVDVNYFETAGIAILGGRDFSIADAEGSPPVAIVNEKLARDYWPGSDAVGRRIQIPGEKQMRQVVGIARTASYSAWGEPQQSSVYIPLAQNYSDSMVLYVRSKGAPQAILSDVRREIVAAGPQIVIGGPLSGREIIDRGLFQPRIGVAMLTIFGLLGLALASIGLYGIIAYSVNHRQREIGLRMAMGAARGTVLRMILAHGMSLVVTGLLIGVIAAVLAARMFSGMLFGVSPGDPISLAGAALSLLGVAFFASYLPARRASRLDPMVTLRAG